MASKKEHKRRQKAKARRQQDDEPQIFPGNELNSLNLLAQVSTSQSGTDGSADEAVANDAGEERENRAESGETSGELERLRYERNLHNAVAADAKERRDAAGSPAGGADADIDTAVNAVTPAGLEADRSLEEAQEAIQALRDAEAS
ncbi:MAG: hypothetical protein LIP23_01790, partial [Planctomycetes bacterium]|nr:hypothetical protein [Planctomycetota bacterium]